MKSSEGPIFRLASAPPTLNPPLCSKTCILLETCCYAYHLNEEGDQ